MSNMVALQTLELGKGMCNLLLSIERFLEEDPVILYGQRGEASMEIPTRDITKVRD